MCYTYFFLAVDSSPTLCAKWIGKLCGRQWRGRWRRVLREPKYSRHSTAPWAGRHRFQNCTKCNKLEQSTMTEAHKSSICMPKFHFLLLPFIALQDKAYAQSIPSPFPVGATHLSTPVFPLSGGKQTNMQIDVFHVAAKVWWFTLCKIQGLRVAFYNLFINTFSGCYFYADLCYARSVNRAEQYCGG